MDKKEILKLTAAEEDIMQLLWDLKQGTVQDILKICDEPKPARTTVATILNILENKGFVTHKTENRKNIYAPRIAKEDYSQKQIKNIIKDYFEDSFSAFATFFIKKNNIEMEELNKLIEDTQTELDKLKNKQSNN